MSFFDEPEETRTAPRAAPRRRRPTGGGRRPPAADRQAFMVRRIGLAVVVIVAIVLIAVLVNSCETSARNSALKDYNNSVASLNEQSVQTGSSFFGVLSGGTSDPTTLQTRLNESVSEGLNQLKKAKGLSVPDEVKGAQQNFVTAMQLRHDGMANVAGNGQATKDQVQAMVLALCGLKRAPKPCRRREMRQIFRLRATLRPR